MVTPAEEMAIVLLDQILVGSPVDTAVELLLSIISSYNAVSPSLFELLHALLPAENVVINLNSMSAEYPPEAEMAGNVKVIAEIASPAGNPERSILHQPT
jgi:hypothetical protein